MVIRDHSYFNTVESLIIANSAYDFLLVYETKYKIDRKNTINYAKNSSSIKISLIV